LVALSAVTISACASASLTQSGALSSYAGLKPSNGVLTKTSFFVDKPAVLSARSARIIPTSIASGVGAGLTSKQLKLISNAVDRTLCRALGERFVMVENDRDADVVVFANITGIGATEVTAARVSAVASIAGAATSLPIPIPRIPYGMGSLSVEAEATNGSGKQVAALVWARGADAFFTRARASSEGDAYTLAAAFAGDFTKLMVTGNDPVSDFTPKLPSVDDIGAFFGADPKHNACKQFGTQAGLADAVGGALGLPADWTDPGPR
jgi:hypothetical protein